VDYTPMGVFMTPQIPSIDPKNLLTNEITSWLEKHSATMSYTEKGIIVEAETKRNNYSSTISGFHNNDPIIAAERVIKKAERTYKRIGKNSRRLDKIVQERNRD